MPRDFHSREGIDEWLQSLDDRWPARAEVSKHLVAELDAMLKHAASDYAKRGGVGPPPLPRTRLCPKRPSDRRRAPTRPPRSRAHSRGTLFNRADQ